MKALLSARLVRFLTVLLFAFSLAMPSVSFAQSEPAAPADTGMEFASWDTLLVGCASGGFSALSAAALPQLTVHAAGGPTVLTSELLYGWAGLGCAIGIWAAVIAIGTAMVLES